MNCALPALRHFLHLFNSLNPKWALSSIPVSLFLLHLPVLTLVFALNQGWSFVCQESTDWQWNTWLLIMNWKHVKLVVFPTYLDSPHLCSTCPVSTTSSDRYRWLALWHHQWQGWGGGEVCVRETVMGFMVVQTVSVYRPINWLLPAGQDKRPLITPAVGFMFTASSALHHIFGFALCNDQNIRFLSCICFFCTTTLSPHPLLPPPFFLITFTLFSL